MASPNLMNEGLMLMIFGMGSVFVFLTLLVIFTTLMSCLLEKYDTKFGSSETEKDSGSTDSIDQDSLLVILTSAVHQYRSRRK